MIRYAVQSHFASLEPSNSTEKPPPQNGSVSARHYRPATQFPCHPLRDSLKTY